MENYQFSKQELETLLAQVRKMGVKYPPDLLAARRRIYLSMAAQVATTRIDKTIKREKWISLMLREPGSIVIKVLITIFVAFLIAFVTHTVATGNVDFGWIIDLLSR